MSQKISGQFRMPVFRAGSFSSYELDLEALEAFIPEGETITEIRMPEDPDGDTDSPDYLGGGVFGIGINETFDALEGSPPVGEEGEYHFRLGIYHTGASTPVAFAIGIIVLPKLEAEDIEDPAEVAAFVFPSAYSIGTVTTDKATHSVNQSAESLSELAKDINIYFAGIEKLYTAQVTDGKLRIKTGDGATIESATDQEENAVPVTAIQAADPVESTSRYFARETPGDDESEYSVYTLVKTCTCPE